MMEIPPIRQAVTENIKKLNRAIKKPRLERYFNRPETLDINGQEVKVIDIKPRRPKTNVPVVFAPGYATSSPLDTKVNILELARQGRRTLYIDEPRGINYEGILSEEGVEKFEKFLLDQVAALIGVLDKKEIEKVDAMAHSEGAMYTLIAASLYPEKFRDLILFDPAGITGGDTPEGLINRFLQDMFYRKYEMIERGETTSHEDDTRAGKVYAFLIDVISRILGLIKKREASLPGKMSDAAKQQMKNAEVGVVKYFMSEKNRSLKEIVAIAKTQTLELLKIVHDHGIGISIVHGVDDRIFPAEKLQKQLGTLGVDGVLPFDGVYMVKGGHGEIYLKPEQYTKAGDLALTALQKKREKREEKSKRVQQAKDALAEAQRKLAEIEVENRSEIK